jgi:hypothetical protein
LNIHLIERQADWKEQDELASKWMIRNALEYQETQMDKTYLKYGFVKETDENGKVVYRYAADSSNEASEENTDV